MIPLGSGRPAPAGRNGPVPGPGCKRWLMLLLWLLPALAPAKSFELPAPENSLVGEVAYVNALAEETLLDIAREHGIGQNEILHANPGVDRWLPGADARVLLPTWYILPTSPPEGLVLNLPEMRLYYYPKPRPGLPSSVQTYPVSIGRMDWATPLGRTTVVAKQKDPSWTPPESVRLEHAADGDPLPRVVPPGPDNPLGQYAMRLGIPGYLIHGTNKPFGVGMQVSHGCIRMLPEDIEHLFPQIPLGTTVRIVNQPAKAGWQGDSLFLEVHPPLEEDADAQAALVESVSTAIRAAQTGRLVQLDNVAIREAVSARRGVPVLISQSP